VKQEKISKFYAPDATCGYTTSVSDKVVSPHVAATWVHSSRNKVVLCHGCYDIIGPAHIDHLMWARALGDCLVVSVSTDEMCQAKGPGRPIIPLEGRVLHLAAFSCVDWVIPWPQRNAEELIKILRPRFYVKGVDTKHVNTEEFQREKIAARSTLCQVRYSPTQSCYHTSDIIKRFQEKQCLLDEILGMEE